MGLFDKRRSQISNASVSKKEYRYNLFQNWLDGVLSTSTIPSDAIAINFNIYDGAEKTYDIEMIAADKFDEEDDDWACSEVFATREQLLRIPIEDDIDPTNNDWFEVIFPEFISLLEKYLENGRNRELLKGYQAVSVGHVSGDLEIVYCSQA